MTDQTNSPHGASRNPADEAKQLVERGGRLGQEGRLAEAAEMFRAALALQPDNAAAHVNLGNVFQAQGMLDEAFGSYRRALELKPDLASAHANLGAALRARGALLLAAASLRRALELDPRTALIHHLLGVTLHDIGQLPAAEASYRQALALKPDFVEAHHDLALALRAQGRLDEADASGRQALALAPGFAEAHNTLGIIALERDAFETAAASFQTAAGLKPQLPEVYVNLGYALQRLWRLEDAERCYRRGIEIAPDGATAYNNLAVTLAELGRIDEAEPYMRKALALRPDYPEAHLYLGQMMLRRGDFQNGWRESEWRWLVRSPDLPQRTVHRQPLWTGESGGGRTLFLWSDEGFGDAIHMARYIAPIERSGWQVIVGVPSQLKRLFAAIPGVRAVSTGDQLPGFDAHSPLLDVPGILSTTVATIPARIPYLQTDPGLVAKWRDQLAAVEGLKIGVAWRGNPSHSRDDRRSMTAAQFAEFLGVPGATVVNFQIDATADERAALAARGPFFDAGPQLGDFADTAALAAQMDLIVTVDTAVAHLGGALGVPVWTLLDSMPDWRWMFERDDSPWYPAMRLFRQPRFGDWPSVIERVRAELRTFIEQHTPQK